MSAIPRHPARKTDHLVFSLDRAQKAKPATKQQARTTRIQDEIRRSLEKRTKMVRVKSD